jgi:hypothetical protein
MVDPELFVPAERLDESVSHFAFTFMGILKSEGNNSIADTFIRPARKTPPFRPGMDSAEACSIRVFAVN